jgi:uncharacterized protein YecE (DUF72 family)
LGWPGKLRCGAPCPAVREPVRRLPNVGRALIRISRYDFKPWRGRFYPDILPARRWLEFASRQFDSIELNGTFYSLKSPPVFERWVAEVPDDFVCAVKGGRFITHNLKLKNADASLGDSASGVLALGAKTGPLLWQRRRGGCRDERP